MDITVAIPSIPPRHELLGRALGGVAVQTMPAAAIAVAVDLEGSGAPTTRQRALEMVCTEWTAFLDDDDEFLPHHLETLAVAATGESADYVFSYYKLVYPGGGAPTDDDPILGHFGRVFDPGDPHQTTTTVLVRTELALQARCDRIAGGTIHGQRAGEDFEFTKACVALGAKIVHVPMRTWLWHHDSGNTSGRSWNRPETWT